MNQLAAAFLLALLGLGGCQKYNAIPDSSSDRWWMVTRDMTKVFRCWDLKNQTGKSTAVCRRAEHVGKTEVTKLTELADATAPPPHPDSTEMCVAQPPIGGVAHR